MVTPVNTSGVDDTPTNTGEEVVGVDSVCRKQEVITQPEVDIPLTSNHG